MDENEPTQQQGDIIETDNVVEDKQEMVEKVETDVKPENNELREQDRINEASIAPVVSKRKNKVAIIFLIVIVLAVATALAWFYLYPNKTLSLYNAEVSLVSGKVEKSETSGTWVELKNGDDVSQGDLVRVNGEGKAIITLDDGSAVRMDSDSQINLTSLDPKNIIIINTAGEVYTRVVKADRPFVVKIGDESFEAMGTAYMTVNDDDKKGVYVYESKVNVVSESKQISEGNKYLTENSADDSLIRKILEISNDEISADTFIQWNKTQDQKSNDFKKFMGVLEAKTTTKETQTSQTENTQTENNQTQQTTDPVVEASITLSGSSSGDAINLSWTATGIDTSHGYKIVKSTSPNPVYPGNTYVYVSSGNSYSWGLTDGVTHNFRVCQYTGNGCGVYSNNIQIKAPFVADGVVNSINLSAGTGLGVSWTVDGYSDKGFKLVWSKTSNPTYPNRSSDRYHYDSSPIATSGSITAFDGNGTYYVRVCEYLGGACGIYSNEITIEVEGSK